MEKFDKKSDEHQKNTSKNIARNGENEQKKNFF